MIAHAFPPEGSAGAYRPLRFVRHLPTIGWNASVISAETASYERYDPVLLGSIPPGTEVIRVPNRDLWQSVQSRRAQRIEKRLTRASAAEIARFRSAQNAPIRSLLRNAMRRAEAWYYHPDMAMGWIQPAVEATVKMAARKRPDVIWATAGPVSSFLVAQRASQHTGVPYVLDFRDAWTITFNEFEARRPAWATRWDRRALYRLLRGAQAVTFRYHTEAECYWRAYPGALDASRIHIIPNGYDGTVDESVIPEGGKCIILYAGTLSSYRYDTLLQALDWLRKSDAARAGRLRLRVVGEGAEVLAADAAALGMSDLVETAGPTSHAEIARLQRDAHALLVLGRPPTMKGHELFAGAKLFGYLKAGRPIVGVLPPDETKRILRRVGVSTIADGSSVSAIVAVLQQLVDAWVGGSLALLVPSRIACAAYSAERQTAALGRALEARSAADPFVPNSVEIPPSLRGDIRDITTQQTGRDTYAKRDGDAFLHS